MIKKNDYCQYQCPNCGRWSDDEMSLLKRSEPEYNYRKALQFGGNRLDWMEYHKCPDCETEYSFDNSNC